MSQEEANSIAIKKIIELIKQYDPKISPNIITELANGLGEAGGIEAVNKLAQLIDLFNEIPNISPTFINKLANALGRAGRIS